MNKRDRIVQWLDTLKFYAEYLRFVAPIWSVLFLVWLGGGMDKERDRADHDFDEY